MGLCFLRSKVPLYAYPSSFKQCRRQGRSRRQSGPLSHPAPLRPRTPYGRVLVECVSYVRVLVGCVFLSVRYSCTHTSHKRVRIMRGSAGDRPGRDSVNLVEQKVQAVTLSIW